jgi:hypothetical protein
MKPSDLAASLETVAKLLMRSLPCSTVPGELKFYVKKIESIAILTNDLEQIIKNRKALRKTLEKAQRQLSFSETLMSIYEKKLEEAKNLIKISEDELPAQYYMRRIDEIHEQIPGMTHSEDIDALLALSSEYEQKLQDTKALTQ